MIKILSVVTEILLILTAYNKFQTFCSLTYLDLPSLEGTSPLKINKTRLSSIESQPKKVVVVVGLELVVFLLLFFFFLSLLLVTET